jgi:Sortase domain
VNRRSLTRLLAALAGVVVLAGCSADPTVDHRPSVPIEMSAAPNLRAADSIEPVVAAPPERLQVRSLGLTATVETMPQTQCPVLDPPTASAAYWVQCRASAGTDSDGTVFIIGHAIAGGDGVFNRLPEIEVGADVVVGTANGSLTYRVEDTVLYDKYGEAQAAPVLAERVPGRLVLVTCYLQDGISLTDKNFVAYATLVGARP